LKNTAYFYQEHEGDQQCSDFEDEFGSNQDKGVNSNVDDNGPAYQCQDCDQKLSTPFDLKVHVQTEHLNVKIENSESQIEHVVKVEAIEVEADIENYDFDDLKNVDDHEDFGVENEAEAWFFQCGVCYEKFTCEDELEQHLDEEHEKQKLFLNCPVCHKNFSTPTILKSHIKAMHIGIKESQVETTPIQDRLLEKDETAIQIKTEESVNSGDESREAKSVEGPPHVCGICNKEFKARGALKTHVKIVHENQRSFPCPDCEKKFPSLSDLKRHLEAVHLGVKNFECDICLKKFSQRSQLERHMKSVHAKEKTGIPKQREKMMVKPKEKLQPLNNGETSSYKCEICNKELKTKGAIVQHIKVVHENQRSFQCDKCDKKFPSPSGLKRHTEAVHQGLRIWQCEICSNKFSQRVQLERHKRAIHVKGKSSVLKKVDPRPKNILCDICGMGFKQVGHLIGHKKNVHDSTKKYECKKCDKDFGTRTNLQVSIFKPILKATK